MRTTIQDGCRWRCIRLCRLARPGWWRHLVPERPRASLHCPTMQGDEDALEEDGDALHWMVIMVVMVIIMIYDHNSTAEAKKV